LESNAFDSFISHRNRQRDLLKVLLIGPTAYAEEQKEKLRLLEYLL